MADVDREGGIRVAADIRHSGGAAVFALTSEESVAAAVSELERRHGRLDILVANAGINPPAPSPRGLGPSSGARSWM